MRCLSCILVRNKKLARGIRNPAYKIFFTTTILDSLCSPEWRNNLNRINKLKNPVTRYPHIVWEIFKINLEEAKVRREPVNKYHILKAWLDVKGIPGDKRILFK